MEALYLRCSQLQAERTEDPPRNSLTVGPAESHYDASLPNSSMVKPSLTSGLLNPQTNLLHFAFMLRESLAGSDRNTPFLQVPLRCLLLVPMKKENVTIFDKIVHIACALTNLCDPIISSD